MKILTSERPRVLGLIAALTTIVSGRALWADALVVTRAMKASTIAEVFVEDAEVRVELEVGVGDLLPFRNVLPDDLYRKLTDDPRPLSERLDSFTKGNWVIHADDRQLAGRVAKVVPRKRVVRDEITGQPLQNQPADAEVTIFVELVYPVDGQPKSLTIRPPLDPSGKLAAANIGFVIYHLGVAVNDFRYLSHEETLDLDWSDPWYSRFERKALRRRYYAPAAAFIYVENYEVRKEIVIRPKDLQDWVDLGLANQAIIKSDCRDAVRQKAAEFLGQHTPVEIDGRAVTGTLDRVHFITRALRISGVVEPGEDIDVNTALLGVIYVYPIESLPQNVTMGWDLFNERIAQVPAVASDEAGGLPSYVTPDDPTLVWQNYLKNPGKPAFMSVKPPPQPVRFPIPVVSVLSVCALAFAWIVRFRTKSAKQRPMRRSIIASIVLVATAVLAVGWPTWTVTVPGIDSREIPAEDITAVTHSLLHNVYRAFDYRDEGTIYNVLDRSVSGDLLPEIYLETQRSLTLTSQGGARVKVTEMELIDCDRKGVEDEAGFIANCTWNVTGSVGHWGHIHQRTNQYRAELAISPVDGQWKMIDMRLLSEERL